jgi:hypothetical protein
MEEGIMWSLITVAGPNLLAAGLLFAMLSNKFQKNQAPKSVTEKATKRLREELNEEDKSRDASV